MYVIRIFLLLLFWRCGGAGKLHKEIKILMFLYSKFSLDLKIPETFDENLKNFILQ